jgi:DNA polymerase/3'-5' exonuclease PolX
MGKNPLLQQKYREGFRDGMETAKEVSAAHFSVKLERLAKLPGIGPKRFKQIVEEFMKDFTPEEVEHAAFYIKDYHNVKKQKGTA